MLNTPGQPDTMGTNRSGRHDVPLTIRPARIPVTPPLFAKLKLACLMSELKDVAVSGGIGPEEACFPYRLRPRSLQSSECGGISPILSPSDPRPRRRTSC